MVRFSSILSLPVQCQPARSMSTTAWAFVSICLLISLRCNCMASVSALDRTKAAPIPPFGQMAPNSLICGNIWTVTPIYHVWKEENPYKSSAICGEWNASRAVWIRWALWWSEWKIYWSPYRKLLYCHVDVMILHLNTDILCTNCVQKFQNNILFLNANFRLFLQYIVEAGTGLAKTLSSIW